ncbi:hypothetical protein D3C79_1061340 [compost metagenome]
MLNTKIARLARMKPGMISYRPMVSNFFHRITVTAPTMMPASAPLRVMPFHSTEISTTGPKAAPKPAQA